MNRPRPLILLLALASALPGCGPRTVAEVCGEAVFPSPAPARPHPVAGFHAYAHAHNDYEHSRPLHDALDSRFYSVEADVFFTGGRFEVSHLGVNSKGTLTDLYLDPLKSRVDATGSVYGNGVPFTLWIDLKDDHAELVSALHTLLSGYPMLARNTATGVEPGAVEVVLTGNAAAKERYSTAGPVRRASRDSNLFAPGDPPADPYWRSYALDWGRYVGWNGGGAIPSDVTRRLECIVGIARQGGRKVRFYAAPDREPVWGAILDVGGDFVGTDNLRGLHAFLAARAGP